jgi:serine/threonine protein kinase
MSPEQVRGESCDGRSDLFSLGSMMYAMCTGHEPFRAESVFAVLQRIVHDDPRSIREQNPAIPEWLEDFIAKLMAKDCGERFPSADHVAELLERELSHLQNPIGPPPVRPWLRRRRIASGSRTRRRLSGIAVAAAAIAASIGIAAWRPWAGEARSGGTSQHATPRTPTLEPPAVPLWKTDGYDAVQAYADALEFGGRSAPAPAGRLDPWNAVVIEFQLRAAEFDQSAELFDERSPSSP